MSIRRSLLAAAALTVAVGLAIPVLTGCGAGGEDRAANAGGGAKRRAGRCERAAQRRPHRVARRRPPVFELSHDKTYTATVVTTCGSFEIELDTRHAPRTGGSFVTLARRGFYDRLGFHRIARGFVVQGGDPKGDGTGGPGYSIREPPPDDVVYSEGTVAMAKTALEPPGTSGSQFFVVTARNAGLEPVYALLGRLTRGLDVVHRIERLPAGRDEMPTRPVVIKSIKIEVR